MVKLRLTRRGRKKHPIYDIIATDSRKRRDGTNLEKLGQYNPMPSPSLITINKERALHWLRIGAQPTDVVRALLSSQGIMLELHLGRKGKTEEEIAVALDKHKATVVTRLVRAAAKKERKKNAPATPKTEE